eukprot:NODE_6988_length_611_cov_33.289256_g6965_i0.p1 GENE.NODE_6988_length_611_cov_33.289256_g6965_i0~~NODE_6988_length_611_cov_33.289256_g6965_i0.p1  ORF type:complete len:170 (+),score=45.41 NODE_6988_length_611_cov_33.289256_g6965_i0:38-511(+)
MAYGSATVTEYGLFYGGGIAQFGVQCLGVVAILLWTAALSTLVFYVLSLWHLLRVDDRAEAVGSDAAHHAETAHPDLADALTHDPEAMQLIVKEVLKQTPKEQTVIHTQVTPTPVPTPTTYVAAPAPVVPAITAGPTIVSVPSDARPWATAGGTYVV